MKGVSGTARFVRRKVKQDSNRFIDILTEAIFRVSAPIEASAFTPEEWKAGNSLLVDYAKNGVMVQ
jgi:hypothetical protein